MKNLSRALKIKLSSKYTENDTPKVLNKSTDINVLLNRVKFDYY